MFRFHKTLDVLSLFHSPKNPESTKVLNLLKTANAHATKSAIDGKDRTANFELDVIEEPAVPTGDQLRSIIEFIGPNRIGDIVKGATSKTEAMRILNGPTSSQAIVRPLLVDWNNGRAVIGADETAIKNLVETLPK